MPYNCIISLCFSEVWKRSGAWFYKALPKHVRPMKDRAFECRGQTEERNDPKIATGLQINRTYKWAHSKGKLPYAAEKKNW